MKQLDKIKRILRTEGQIDNFRCFSERISLRLGARIFDLTQEGWRFEACKDPNNPKNYIYKTIKDPGDSFHFNIPKKPAEPEPIREELTQLTLL